MADLKEIKSHRWAETGLFMEDKSMWTPCLDCYDTLRLINEGANIHADIIPNGFAPIFESGVELDLVTDSDAISKIVCMEIRRDYDLDNLELVAGDVVIDIGAHKGIISCYLAKRYPGIKVYAYEPMVENYAALVENARRNNIEIEAHNMAVTGNGRDVSVHYSNNNSGGANIYAGDDVVTNGVKSISFADVLRRFEKIALLKIDCEGAEYELDPKLLDHVAALRGELHNSYGNADKLLDEIKQHVSNCHVTKQH